MRFQIGKKTYEAADIRKLDMRSLLFDLPTQTEELGRRLEAAEVDDMNVRLEKIKDASVRGRDPDAKWGIAISIWASRRLAGENLTIAEALNFPAGDLVYLPETQDHKKPADPTKTRPASGRVAKSRAVKGGSSSSGRSRKASTGG